MTEPRHPARYWSKLPDGRLRCELCPRFCALRDGQRGMCFVRMREGDRLVLDTYGRSSGFCIDPVEKKPLNHFLPGTAVLSFGTAGCNLACKFCQNYDISTAKSVDRLADRAAPEALAAAARAHGCASVAYTYNDPVIFLEYAVDTAIACREVGVRSVAVTAGYIEPEPRAEFFARMDAANIDLKGFTPEFYRKLTGAHIEPVLETIAYVAQETACWLELTTLLIPGENDSPDEIAALAGWVRDSCGPDTPVHFTAFTPQHRMPHHPPTPLDTVLAAQKIASDVGMHHVFSGNVHHKPTQSSYCTGCGQMVIGRDWYRLSDWHLDDTGHCTACGTRFAGVIEGPPGTWGPKRQPIRIGA